MIIVLTTTEEKINDSECHTTLKRSMVTLKNNIFSDKNDLQKIKGFKHCK